jgi:hypothetical protein
LNTALQSFTALNLDELPVMDPKDHGKLLGMLRRKETIAAYNQRILAHRSATDEDDLAAADAPLWEGNWSCGSGGVGDPADSHRPDG